LFDSKVPKAKAEAMAPTKPKVTVIPKSPLRVLFLTLALFSPQAPSLQLSVAVLDAFSAAEAQLARSLAPITGALSEAKAAGHVRSAQLYHALAGAMGRKAAAFATDDSEAHKREKAAVKAALAALAAAGEPTHFLPPCS